MWFEEDEGVGGILLAEGVGLARGFKEGGRIRGLECQANRRCEKIVPVCEEGREMTYTGASSDSRRVWSSAGSSMRR